MRETSRDGRSGKDHSSGGVRSSSFVTFPLACIKAKDLHCGLSQLCGITADASGRDV